MPSIVSQSIVSRRAIARRQIGAKVNPEQVAPVIFTMGTTNWSPPVAGFWKFGAWGPGGGAGGTGAASGGFAMATRFLTPAQIIPIVVGASETSDTTVTLPGGVVMTATRATTGTPGTATGGDTNLSGSAPGNVGLGDGGGPAGAVVDTTSGAGAPAILPFRGGRGGPGNSGIVYGAAGGAPGAGSGGNAATTAGGGGLVVALFVRS